MSVALRDTPLALRTRTPTLKAHSLTSRSSCPRLAGREGSLVEPLGIAGPAVTLGQLLGAQKELLRCILGA